MKRLSSLLLLVGITGALPAQDNFPDVRENYWFREPMNSLRSSGLLTPHRNLADWPPYWIGDPWLPNQSRHVRWPSREERFAWARALLAGVNNVNTLLGKSKPHNGGWGKAEGALGQQRIRLACAYLPVLKRSCSTLEKELAQLGADIESLKRGLFVLNAELEAAIDVPFRDVPKAHWAKVAIADLGAAELVRGYPAKQ